MKKLKQTLCKQQPKKHKTTHPSTSSNINTNSNSYLPSNTNRTPILTSTQRLKQDRIPTYLFKSPNKSIGLNKSINEGRLQNLIVNAVESYFKRGKLEKNEGDIDGVVKQIMEKCEDNEIYLDKHEKSRLNKTSINQQLNKLEQIKQLVEQMLQKKQQGNKNKQLLMQFHEQLGKVIKNKNKITKKQKLEEYDRLIKLLSPRKNIKSKQMHIPISMSMSIPNNKSPGNVKVKVTKQQYEIKREYSDEQNNVYGEDESPRMGSEGKRVKTAGSNHSGFKSQNGNQKLKKLLKKQPSLKIIKTKVQYDYSAIFEASKSKIQQRNKNMTTMGQTNTKSNNDVNITSKLNKVKKNQAFVFYRPKNGKKE